MRWAYLAVFLVLASLAYATPPPSPTAIDLSANPLPTTEHTLTLSVPGAPSAVNSTVNITYSHTAPTTLNCSLFIESKGYFNATMKGERGVVVTLTNGSHYANVTCRNATINLSSKVTFTVINEAGSAYTPKVTLVSPGDESPPNVTIRFWHNAPTNASCNVTIDDADEPMYKVKKAVPSTNYTTNVFFEDDEYGDHDIEVFCKAGDWKAKVTQTVDVSDEYAEDTGGDLKFSPATLYPGMTVTISGEFQDPDVTNMTLKIIPPSGAIKRIPKLLDDSTFKITYVTAMAGKHKVTATSDLDEVLNGSFTVKERTPSISISGNKTNITQGSAFTVLGEQFPPEDNITIIIIGGGSTITNKSYSDDVGSFSFAGPKTLVPNTYTITAKSVSDPTQTDSVTLTVLAPAPVQNTTPPAPTQACGNGKQEGTEACDRGPSNGACPAECSGSCKLNDCPIEDSVDEPPVNSGNDDYGDDTPPAPDPSYDYPSDPVEEQPSGVNLSWIWYVVIAIVVLGGAFGYFVYNGTIDLSGFGIGGGSGPTTTAPSAGAPIDYAEEQTIKSFIYGERGKGFDDLTIRGSLIGKGWDKEEVDRVFDEIYKSQ